jgi:thiamine transport system permease protein
MAKLARSILTLLPLLFLGLFFLVPLWAIMQRALLPKGTLAASQILGVFTSRSLLGVIWFSAWQAALSTILTLLAATPAAYVFARYRFPGKTALRSLAAVPFVLPTVVVALAFGALLNERGLVNTALMRWLDLRAPPIRIQDSLTLVLIAHVFYNFTVVLRLVGGYWASADPRLEEAARVLGASRWRVWREVTLPLVAPALLAAALLVFTFTFAAFGTVLILGGPTYRTIEVEIYDQAVNQFNLPVAAVLSLIQMLATLSLTLLYTRLVRRSTVAQETRPQAARRPASWRSRLAVSAVVGLMLVLLGSPLVALVARAFSVDGAWSTRYFALLSQNTRGSYFFVPPGRAVVNSLSYAGITTALGLLFGIPAAYLLARPRTRLTRLLDPLFMLPLGTSAVTLGFGYIIAFRSYNLFGWQTPDLRRWPGLLPLAHTLLALPFVTRTLLPALRRLNPRLREAAAVLGATPQRILWEIDAPLLLPAVIVAALFAFTVSLGDFGAALVLSVTSPETATMPVVIYQFFGQPGSANYGQALAMSSVLMLVTLVSFAAIERLRDESAEF